MAVKSSTFAGWLFVIALLVFLATLRETQETLAPYTRNRIVRRFDAKNHTKLEILSTITEEDAEDFLLPKNSTLLSRLEWDLSPIVVEEFKLIFFSQAKVGCTVWKQLFRRIKNYSDWRVEDCCGALLPWNPQHNGLTYLYDFDRVTASHMLQDKNWTKAVFVRDPIERFVSAWLDKAVNHKSFLRQQCCERFKGTIEPSMCDHAKTSIMGFVDLIRVCDNDHWRPQTQRLPDLSYWRKFINFVGRMETVAQDAEVLLRKLGAWEEYGASGWGEWGNQSIFEGTTGRRHATSAKSKIHKYVSENLELLLRTDLYGIDYNNPVFSRYAVATKDDAKMDTKSTIREKLDEKN